jgi:hypothetical protein
MRAFVTEAAVSIGSGHCLRVHGGACCVIISWIGDVASSDHIDRYSLL